MYLSVIIPTYNREQTLLDTITSVISDLKESGIYDCSEIIIVNQTIKLSDNMLNKLETLVKQNANLIIIKEKIPNLPNARNIGIRISKGKILIFLDDDVKLIPGFFNACLKKFQDKSIASVVGRSILVNGNRNVLLDNQSFFKKIIKRFLINVLCRGKCFNILKNGLILSDPNCRTSMFVDAGQGCNMSFRREVFNKVGIFDTNYIGNALREETDLFFRIKKSNMKIYYESNMALFHIMKNTGGCRNDKGADYWERYFYNQSYFYIKNYGFTINRIKAMLIFDYIKCMQKNIDIKYIFSIAYNNAKQKNMTLQLYKNDLSQ